MMVLAIAAVWGGYLFTRHRERMTMLEKGLKPEDIKVLYEKGAMRFHPLSALKWGFLLSGTGLAVLIAMMLQSRLGLEDGVYPGLIALMAGLGLVLFYLVARRQRQ